MELVLVVVALAMSGCWAGLRLAVRAKGEAAALRRLNATLETRAELRAQELRSALAAAEGQAAQVEAAHRAKAEFLASMSHELRTPLNAVIGFSDLMRMNEALEPLTHRQHQALEQIRAAGGRLLTLVDEVLNLADIEGGRLALSVERVDPLLIARQVCEALGPMAEAAGIALCAPPPVSGLAALADRERLRQVLTALIANAVKYNRPGGAVLIEARQSGEGVSLNVSDTGPGLPVHRMEGLFQPFNRLGREASEVAGAGLGLAVARRLIEAMGGELNAESREGEGAVFTVRLPVATGTPRAVTASFAPTMTLPEATLLYVEDNPSNIALMRHVITALGGMSLHVAETGPQGLALARDLRPDVVILDINLPGMNGFELKARMAEDPLTRCLPVLALSASATPADMRRGREAGFVEYLTKPLHIPALAAALSRALSSAAASAPARPVAAAPTGAVDAA
ncbi:ATP-binding protein [Brevundimonas sp.]|uniref:hybrid sensor histidine kinase/response regulator n=1 Tax=Brevundimonas sp. TaxID=1871086 RepID=UPI00289F1DE8|nr:ATP-binding protein [Brevundimonas sp.]